MSRYTEIFRLKDMLEQAGIPFEFIDRSVEACDIGEMYQIAYPTFDYRERVCSVVQGYYTYGSDCDALEIMGLLTEDEEMYDSVKG